jgi:hypothetical protein
MVMVKIATNTESQSSFLSGLESRGMAKVDEDLKGKKKRFMKAEALNRTP